jgi:hypothetical protein
MSGRPTTQKRLDCNIVPHVINTETANSGTTAGIGYTIIGDTIASILYGKRLINNNVIDPVSSPLNLMNEGIDKTHMPGLDEIEFPARNIKKILQHLTAEQIHLIDSGDEISLIRDDVLHYHVGSNVLGDFVGTYFSPRVGPYFSGFNPRIKHFVDVNTIRKLNSPKEMSVVNCLSKKWKIPITNSVSVLTPSILNCQYIFINKLPHVRNEYTRNIFLDDKIIVEGCTGAYHIDGVTTLKFSSTNIPNVYNITGSDVARNSINIKNTRIAWKTNPYTFLRLATNGGLNPKPLMVPTFYRARITIPKDSLTKLYGCTGTESNHPNIIKNIEDIPAGEDKILLNRINSSTYNCSDDLVTSLITFSLHDLNNPTSSALSWLVQAYTTVEDLSITDPSGVFTDSNSIFLIIEAISTKNKRIAVFDYVEQETVVTTNKTKIEKAFELQFATLVSDVYQAYTGVYLSPSSLITDTNICNSNGSCQDANMIRDYSLRESPLTIVVQTIISLYGTDATDNYGMRYY